LPMHVMAKYTMLNKRVDAHTRDVCLSHVQKVVEDVKFPTCHIFID